MFITMSELTKTKISTNAPIAHPPAAGTSGVKHMTDLLRLHTAYQLRCYLSCIQATHVEGALALHYYRRLAAQAFVADLLVESLLVRHYADDDQV